MEYVITIVLYLGLQGFLPEYFLMLFLTSFCQFVSRLGMALHFAAIKFRDLFLRRFSQGTHFHEFVFFEVFVDKNCRAFCFSGAFLRSS